MAEVEIVEPGLNVENLKIVVKKLKEAIGDKWVSDDPTATVCYSGDFTHVAGVRPQIVVLPSSTEDVQQVLRIAYEHKVPVIPMGTGFNHAGLCVPRRGGIVLDLAKRMIKISVDEESMTMTVEPGIRCAAAYDAAHKHHATSITTLRPAIPMTMGSVSILSNYVSAGGAGQCAKMGFSAQQILGMTWVLPNGDILKLGTSSLPNVGNINACYLGPGPTIMGMCINANGMMGVCTEMTIKLFPEPEPPLEKFYVFVPETPEGGLDKSIDFIRKITQQDFTDFIYKSHIGMALALAASMPEIPITDELLTMVPMEDTFMITIMGETEEECSVREEILMEIAAECGLMSLDLEMLLGMAGGTRTLELKDLLMGLYKKVGPNTVGRVMAKKGSFQWTACTCKLEQVPDIFKDGLLIYKKYHSSDPLDKMPHGVTLHGGASSFGRYAFLEIDTFCDQGDPEEVKRLSVFMRKIHQTFLKHNAPLFREASGDDGWLALPLTGVSYDILKKVKKLFDPDNLMNPDIEPVFEDYV